MSSEPLTRISYYFPWSLLLALVLAIIFAAIGVAIFRGSFADKTDDDSLPSIETMFPFLEPVKLYLARFGFFATDSLSKSFLYASQLMQSFMGGTQFRYTLPWVVMMGTSSSGKSSLLESLSLDRPIGKPSFATDKELHPSLDWWFYDHGIVLDLNGNLVIDSNQITSDERQWRLFLNLLANYRPKRALDGVVLTIPATELVGTTALSHNTIMERAEHLYGKLWLMQHITGIRVPVYIVVTKCDLVPGFESLCKSLPTHNKRDIFGWSNDHAIESAYDPCWVEEAFSTINQSLYRTQQEIYADAKAIDGRDGVFLFPLTLNHLKGRLKTYLNHIFKDSGYHESFFLRGLYFVGDSHFTPPQKGNVEKIAALSVKQNVTADSKRIYFGNDLFEGKIFREIGLARPISKLLLGNTTAIRFIKIGVAIAAILGTIGLLYANERLQTAKLSLAPSLNQISVSLQKVTDQTDQGNNQQNIFDTQAETLLDAMTQVSAHKLQSIYLPPSWVSTIDAKIKVIMAIAYSRLVLDSIYKQLTNKATDLVNLYSLIPVTEVVGDGIDPLKTAEFYKLRNYVASLKDLQNAADKFNGLGQTTTLKDIAGVIKYLFDYDVPSEFYENTAYINALKFTNVKLFSFQMYGNDATIKLHTLFDDFQSAIFDPTKTIPGLSQFKTITEQFAGARNYSAYDAELLRNIFTSLQQTINSINSPELQWLKADNFNPGQSYEKVFQQISDSDFVRSVTGELISEINHNFKSFRQKLGGYTSPLIDGGTVFATENTYAIPQPSVGASSLLNNLTIFYAQSFMAEAQPKAIITAIPIGSVLLWDTLRLQTATALINDFNNFLNAKLLSFPKEVQPIFQKVGRENLTLNLVNYTTDAEIFSPTANTGSALSPEDALMNQVQNYRAASPYLEQILFALFANNANTAFTTLKSLLTTQASIPIKTLDNILSEDSPYAIKDNSFDWWTGENMASLEAFGVHNLTDLNNYLELQRNRINYLGREFAEPLVNFLVSINKQGMPEGLPLVVKWSDLIKELMGYEQKTPGNGLASLESYILEPLNEVTLATCQKYASSVSQISGDDTYFASILINIQEKLYERCVELSGDVSLQDYTNLATFFNANLSGKFPFTETADPTCLDVDPNDIRTFYEMLDAQSADIKTSLSKSTVLGPAGQNAATFIDQMDKVRTFFGGYLKPNSTLPSPAFAYKVTFRTNQGNEVRGNEILNWYLTTKDASIDMRSKSFDGLWNFGDPMQVIFRWAINSPLQPLQPVTSVGYKVQGENAIFSYGGTWALLRLLRMNQASLTDFQNLIDPMPITLNFKIPLTNVISNTQATDITNPLEAKVFLSLKVMPLNAPPDSSSSQSTSGSSTTSNGNSTGSSNGTSSTSNGSSSSSNGSSSGSSSASSSNGTSSGTSSSQPQVSPGSPVSLPYFPYTAPVIDNTTS